MSKDRQNKEERGGHEQKTPKTKDRNDLTKGEAGPPEGINDRGQRIHLEKLHVSPHVLSKSQESLGS